MTQHRKKPIPKDDKKRLAKQGKRARFDANNAKSIAELQQVRMWVSTYTLRTNTSPPPRFSYCSCACVRVRVSYQSREKQLREEARATVSDDEDEQDAHMSEGDDDDGTEDDGRESAALGKNGATKRRKGSKAERRSIEELRERIKVGAFMGVHAFFSALTRVWRLGTRVVVLWWLCVLRSELVNGNRKK